MSSTNQSAPVADINLNSFYLLKDSMETAQLNTNSMLFRLQHFEERLLNLDDKMKPIQEVTTTLSSAKRNVGLAFLEIEKTHEYFQLAKENSVVISGGFKLDTVLEFFEAIERITVAKRYFDDHRDMKSAHTALINVDNMIKRAMMHCVEEMNRIYKSCGKTFEEKQDGSFVSLNPLMDTKTVWIKTISDCLEAHQVTQHLPMYQEQRTLLIKSELKHYQGPSLATLALLRGETLLFSAVVPNSTPQTEKVFYAICSCIMQELSGAISAFIGPEASILNVINEKSSDSFKLQKSDKNFDPKRLTLLRKSNVFLIQLDILDTFLANFFDLRNLSSPEDHRNKVQKAPTEALLDNQRRSIVESCIAGLNSLLLAIRMSTSTNSVSSTVGSGLGGTSTGGSDSNKIPLSSTEIHPISGYVLCFCKEVVEFENVYQAMLQISIDLNISIEYIPTSTISLESYMIDGLMSQLQERTKGMGSRIKLDGNNKNTINLFDPNIRMEEFENLKIYLFLINNMDVIATHLRGRLNALKGEASGGQKNSERNRTKSVRKTSLHAIKNSSAEDDTPLTVLSNQYNSVENRTQIAVNELCTVVSTVLLTCIDLDASKSTAEGRTKKAFQMTQSLLDRQLKTCFGAFNESMDSLLTFKNQFRISSKDLRDRVQTQLSVQIMESYSTFFEKYSKVNFSKKNKESYLRYPPNKVETVLGELFN